MTDRSRGRDLNLAARSWLKVGARTLPAVASSPLRADLAEARLAVVSTGGARLSDQAPFDTGRLGDPTFRAIPAGVEPEDLVWEHPHYDTALTEEDPDCVFPLGLVRRLADEGIVGGVAPTAFSLMGYAPLTRPVVEETAPEIGQMMQGERVDAALLCPA
ncbi:MAG: glycine/sarcosine/betaine reductase selenoprotein B family protein [Gemmatimonadota bacterium]